jgi:hypothetical protein
LSNPSPGAVQARQTQFRSGGSAQTFLFLLGQHGLSPFGETANEWSGIWPMPAGLVVLNSTPLVALEWSWDDSISCSQVDQELIHGGAQWHPVAPALLSDWGGDR